MIAELGHYALVLALAIAVFQAIAPLIGAAQRNALMHAAVPAALVQFLAVATAFAALTHAYLISDFSVANVFENSHSAKPLIYKISGVWGNHEGSMVLWVLILAIFGALVALFGGNLPETLKARVLAVQGAVGAAFLLFIVATSNPFMRLVPPPVEGNGLNPILQDPALAFHPPFLYMGYVGLSVAFSFAVAALIEGRVDPAWARWVRPWTLAAWMFLTVGIAMGSWWAYYELGWGGWWFWDPVENASFMPWLVATALLHSAIVVEKRNALKIWTVLLAIIAFSLSLLGTFLVRSGVLTSVHAFAVDPARGVFILGILCFFIGGALTLFAWRAPKLQAGGIFAPVSREGGLVMNNVLLCVAAAAVLTGTLYPLALESVTGEKISVGPPYFNLTFGPIILPLLLLMPLGPFLTWKRADARGVMQRVWIAAVITVAAGVLAAAVLGGTPVLAVLGVALGVWMIAGSLVEFAEKIALFRTSFKATLSRLLGLPAAAIGMTLAHLGMGVMVIGIMSISTLKEEHIVAMKPSDAQQVGGYTVTFVSETPFSGPNYTGRAGRFTISKDGAEKAVVISEKRQFRPRGMDTTEVGLHAMLAGDVYVVLGDATDDGGRVVRLFYNPWVSLIWLGAAVMFAGGGISLFDRRYRIGAPKPAARAAMAPAE